MSSQTFQTEQEYESVFLWSVIEAALAEMSKTVDSIFMKLLILTGRHVLVKQSQLCGSGLGYVLQQDGTRGFVRSH